MQWGKRCKHSKSQKMLTYKGAKHVNIQRHKPFKQATAQKLQTFKVAKDENIQRRKL